MNFQEFRYLSTGLWPMSSYADLYGEVRGSVSVQMAIL